MGSIKDLFLVCVYTLSDLGDFIVRYLGLLNKINKNNFILCTKIQQLDGLPRK